MTKADKIFEGMLAGRPLEELDDSSKSSWYEAYTRWRPKAQEEYMGITAATNIAKAKRTQFEEATKEAQMQLDDCRNILDVETKNLETTRAANEDGQAKLRKIKAEITSLEGKLSYLEERGVTEEALAAVGSMDVRNSEELLNRVRTVKEAESLKTENAALEARLKQKSVELDTKISALETVKLETQSETNRRDEFRKVNAVYITMLDFLMQFFKRGYNESHIKMLLEGLRKLEIAGDPKRSVIRAIEALQGNVLLEELDSSIRLKKAAIMSLQANIDDLKGEVEAYRDVALAALKQVSAAAVQSIGSLGDKHTAALTDIHNQGMCSIKNLGSEIRSQENDMVVNMAGFEKYAESRVLEIHTMVTRDLQQYKAEVDEWGNMRETIGQFEELLQNTMALLAAKKDISLIQKLPSDFVLNLLRGIDLWVQVKLPDAETQPSKTLYEKERWAFSSIYAAKLKNVSSWVVEDLTRRHGEGQL